MAFPLGIPYSNDLLLRVGQFQTGSDFLGAGQEDVRQPSDQELKATSVIRVPLDEVSAKIRTGPPVDGDEDYQLDCWAGEVPLTLVPQAPVADPLLPSGIALPAYARDYRR